LSRAEEKALVRWILEVAKAGYLPRKPQVHEMAEQIRHDCVSKIHYASIAIVEYHPISEEWVDRFLQRHPSLQTAYAPRIDLSRMKETTADTILRWLNTVCETIDKYHVNQENI